MDQNDKVNCQPMAFNLMAKPAGPACNLACRYCFYLEKEKYYPGHPAFRMSDEVLETFIKQYIEAQDVPEVCFAWQGGEPTLLGVDFYKKAVELQKKYAAGKSISNSFQSNVTLIDEEWCQFFKDNNFLVGASIDGPERFHNHYRVDRNGQGSYARVIKAIKLMQFYGVEFNAMCCVNSFNVNEPLKIYNFFKKSGINYMQFIPIVERLLPAGQDEDDFIPGPIQKNACDAKFPMADWSVDPKKYGKFLNTIFDEWVRNDVGKVFVQQFDATLGNWIGVNNSVCVFSKRCGNAVIIEHNGDIFSCDHYMYSGYKLGNILTDNLREMVSSEFQQSFGDFKEKGMPQQCLDCDYLFACRGGCSKHRFDKTRQGDLNLNHLCKGFQRFFKHVTPAMNLMANLLKEHRGPAEIMQFMAQQDFQAKLKKAKKKDKCPCGSGKMFKDCHGKFSSN